jgi:hypothetical protein
LNERIKESNADLGKHRFEVEPLRCCEPVEDQEKVTVAVESARFNVQETHEVFELDVALPLKIYLLAGKSL